MGLPSRSFVVASLAKWRASESYRYGRWRHYVQTKPRGHYLRSKWFKLYQEAQVHRVERERQLARIPIRHVDQDGLALIRAEEGSRNHPYDDSRGFATVGVGHLIDRRSIRTMTSAELERWTLTNAEIDALLRKDLVRFERAVAKAFAAKGALPVTQNGFNACVSLAFNIGEDGFATSTVASEIKKRHKTGAANAFLLWDHPPELLPRRRRERALFLRG